jgi:hypothetical protein
MPDDSSLAVSDLLARGAPKVFQAPVTRTVFWTGAGISADLPTGAPVGNTLADRAMEHCFAAGTADIAADYYQQLRVSRTRPRLETLLEVARQVHGLPALVDLLSDLRRPPPNGLHEFFAAHASAGGRHITANFDPCIELAAAASGRRADVLHFHGSFADDATGDNLGATLARIERGFPADIRDRLTGTMTAAPGQVLVFAGYSGSDFFDVDPFLRQLAATTSLAGTVVLWVDHGDGQPRLISGQAAAGERQQLGWLSQAGAEVHQVTAPARLVLAALAAAWRLPPPPAPAHGAARSWQPSTMLAEPARQRASLELFALMGLHREVAALLDRHGGPDCAREWEIAAHTWWAAGRYRRASAAWQRARPGDNLAARVARQERIGACQWIRGQYSRAFRTLRHTLNQATMASTDQLDPELQLQAAETLGRVWVHMRRTPDTRLLATRRRRAFILYHLPDAGSGAQPRLGTHLQARIQSVRTDLGAPGSNSEPWQASQAAFAEYEALHARLNYRHAELRHANPPADGHEFRQLQQDFRVLGAYGDAARVPLIPGGEAAFTVRETLQGLHHLDITWWHRWRLSAGYMAKRLHAAVSRHNRASDTQSG